MAHSKARKTINGVLLDISHGAAFLGITERALRARVARHQIPFHKWQGRVVFSRSELEKFIETIDGCSVREALENVRGAAAS